jgi:hypothetical protein
MFQFYWISPAWFNAVHNEFLKTECTILYVKKVANDRMKRHKRNKKFVVVNCQGVGLTAWTRSELSELLVGI